MSRRRTISRRGVSMNEQGSKLRAPPPVAMRAVHRAPMQAADRAARPLRTGEALAPAASRRCGRARIGAIALAIAAAYAIEANAGITYVVNTNADPAGPVGSLSLRQAIAAANTAPDNTVQFDAALSGSTITLTSGEIVISQPMQVA